MTYPHKTRMRKGEDFSATEKLNQWTRNPSWKSGYESLISGLAEYSSNNSEIWRIVSGMSEDIMKDFYFKIDNFMSNVSDIDTCEIKNLSNIAKGLGYSGNLDFLEYDYPIEIEKLLNLFSINANYVKDTTKILNSHAIDQILPELSSNISGSFYGYTNIDVHFDEKGNRGESFNEETWSSIQELSSSVLLYKHLDTEKYLDYVEESFKSCISSFIHLKYRHAEIYDNTSKLPYTKFDYIWKYIGDQLYGQNLFKDLDTNVKSILDLKARLGIFSDFPVVKIVDDIQAGKSLISDYSEKEQLVINAELDYRKELLEKAFPISRYSPEREKKVRKYFQLIKTFNNSNYIAKLDEYDIDSELKILTEGELSLGEGPLIKTQSTLSLGGNVISCPVDLHKVVGNDRYETQNIYSVNEEYINKSAEFFRNLSLKISHFRESTKILAKKNFLTGTPALVRILIFEIFNKYVYDSSLNWRMTSESSQFPEIPNPGTLEVIIQEYLDGTEYFNISSNLEYGDIVDSTLLNSRYWEQYQNISGDGLELTEWKKEQLLSIYNKFFETVIEKDYHTREKLETSSQKLQYLYDFISFISESSSPSAYEINGRSSINYVESESAFYGKLVSPLAGFINPWIIKNARIEYDDNYSTHTTGRIFAEFASSYLKEEVVFQPSTITETQIIEIPPEIPGNPPTFNEVLVEQNISVPSDVVFRPVVDQYLLNGTLSNISHFYQNVVIDNWSTIQNEQILCGDVENLSLTANFIGNISALFPDPSTPISPTVLYEGAITANIGSVNRFVDSREDLFYNYTNTLKSKFPYFNIKNTVHPTWATYPNIFNFSKKTENTVESFSNILQQIVEQSNFKIFTEFITARYDLSGNSIDSWKKDNIDFTGYQTFYENSFNTSYRQNDDKNIDIDGPWNPVALKLYLEDPIAYANSIIEDSTELYDNFQLKLSQEERLSLGTALLNMNDSSVYFGKTIHSLRDAKIYRYCVDPFENHYFLYKNSNSPDEFGEIWVRYKNHPLAIPFVYNVQCPVYDDFQCAAIGAYDFGIVDSTIWIRWNNNTATQKDSNLHGQINFATLSIEEGKNKIIASRPTNSEGFISIPPTAVLAGIIEEQSQIIAIIASIDPSTKLFATNPQGEYVTSIGLYTFNINSGITFQNVSDVVSKHQLYRDEKRKSPSGVNCNPFKSTKSSNSLFVAFEYRRNLEAFPKNIFGQASSSNIENQYDGGAIIDEYENGVALIKFNIVYSNSGISRLQITDAENLIRYYEPFSNAGYIPLFVNQSTSDEYQRVYEVAESGDRDIALQLFMTAFPSNNPAQKNRFEIYPDLGKFEAHFEGPSIYTYEDDGEPVYQAFESADETAGESLQYTAEQFLSNIDGDDAFKLVIRSTGGTNLGNIVKEIEIEQIGSRGRISSAMLRGGDGENYRYYDLPPSETAKYYNLSEEEFHKYLLTQRVSRLMNTYFIWDGDGKIRARYAIEEFKIDDDNAILSNLRDSGKILLAL